LLAICGRSSSDVGRRRMGLVHGKMRFVRLKISPEGKEGRNPKKLSKHAKVTTEPIEPESQSVEQDRGGGDISEKEEPPTSDTFSARLERKLKLGTKERKRALLDGGCVLRWPNHT